MTGIAARSTIRRDRTSTIKHWREEATETFNLLIDGRPVPGDTTMPVINPATEELLAEFTRLQVINMAR